jgi:asparagine synthase (glutamine-hydrolysing)
MSDFLLSLDKRFSPGKLVNLAQMPYPYRRPEGEAFGFPWGNLAVLQERFGKNVFRINGAVVAWVGDLVTEVSKTLLESLVSHTSNLRDGAGAGRGDLGSESVLDKLNGCFAFIIADAQGFSIITDPMNFVQVYAATDGRGRVSAVGTHPDLVASVGGQAGSLDLTSLGEFLNAGTPLFPNTVYQNVKELHPGSVYGVIVSGEGRRMKRNIYWTPPDENRDGYSENDLSEELREILLSIVRARCRVSKAGVFLSGGLDSRLIMAAVPESVQCVGLTFSNAPNRETRTARRVAECYHREWVLLLRRKDYLADCLVDAVRLTGCEFEWTTGQVIAFAKELEQLRLDVILEGTLFNDYFTAFCAREWEPEKRWGGFLPSRYRKTDWNYLEQISAFWRAHLIGNTLDLMQGRRQRTYDMFADTRRGSIAEWMEIYPFTQDPTVGYWPAERRTLPVRLVAMDRRTLDFSFRCPIELKLGSRLYTKAVCGIYGAGKRIPNANNGVRPGSGHWSRLAQRTVHELKRGGIKLRERLGQPAPVQTSWHDYQRYWRESPRLRQLCREYEANLDEFDDVLIKGGGRDLLGATDLYWEYGFRLLQLAVWREVIRSYKV